MNRKTKRTFGVKWLVFTVFYVVGGLCCLGLGMAWYQNEENIRVAELMRRVELSLKPIIMVAEVGISARNYYILDNEDFIRLFHLEPGLLFFRMEGKSDLDEPFEFSYCPPKGIGSYSKYPKLYDILLTDSPKRKEKKENLNRQIMQKVEVYQKQIAEFKRPPELNRKTKFYDSESNHLSVLTKIKNKNNGGELWAVFDATDIAKVKRDVFQKVLIISLIALLMLIIPAMIIAQLVAKPLDRLVKQLTQQVENLDLSTPLSVDTFLTEIKQVVMSMNSLTKKLNRAIGHTQEAASAVGNSAGDQAAAVEETSASMEEIATMTKQNASNAQEASKLMTAVSKEIYQANDSMELLTHAMDELSEASDKTAKIIEAIDGIAFQTNLLALNAAVEAARAGEAGAGFAVVADEVKTLAQRSAGAANDTGVLIEDTLKKIKESIKLVNRTSEAFEEAVGRSKKATALVTEIASASQEQAQGIEHVNKALAQMDKTTQRNATQADELTVTMSQFTTDHTQTAEEAQTADEEIRVVKSINNIYSEHTGADSLAS
jgi:methyl-accepting chemotaxis protein